MSSIIKDGVKFEVVFDMVEVSSNHRPDINWLFRDSAGHVHRWYEGDVPADTYQPTSSYTVPSTKFVSDGVRYDDDGEEHDVGHYECRGCGQTVVLGYTADEHRHFMRGLARRYIDGQSVTVDEFKAKAIAAGLGPAVQEL